MARYKLTLQYLGTGFHGFQKQQSGLPTIQQELELAIHKLTKETVTVVCAGRTDTGVHALGQVVHFDIHKVYEEDVLKRALNYHLRPNPISVIDAERLPENSEFHARFSAKKRHYTYKILNQNYEPVLHRNLALWVARPLNTAKMHEATQLLIGKHDFSLFRSNICQAKSAFKNISSLELYSPHRERYTLNAHNSRELYINIAAPSFLHHQVRFIVGALVAVGTGKEDLDYIEKLLTPGCMLNKPPLVAAHGLYFTKVSY